MTLFKYILKMDTLQRLCDFMRDEARSCSMDFGCITPLYVYRMWGGAVSIDEISKALGIIRKYDYK